MSEELNKRVVYVIYFSLSVSIIFVLAVFLIKDNYGDYIK